MVGSPTSPSGKGFNDTQLSPDLRVPKRTIMDAFNHTSYYEKEPEIGFGTGSRPPLNNPTGGPGPGAYPIKTTLGYVIESNITSPPQYTIRGRTKFGDPNEKNLTKTASSEPGPGQYDLTNKFQSGKDPRRSAFPKAAPVSDKSQLAPGPGSYTTLQSMGKQVLSTKKEAYALKFPKAERPSLVPEGTTQIGPGEYNPPPAACEEQIDSRKPTCPTIKIGEGFRRGVKNSKFDFSEPSPGPGAYVLPGGVATKAKGTPYRSSPAASLSGREKFGSPW